MSRRETIEEILDGWLLDNNYDGLYQPGECACERKNLVPCGASPLGCYPGVKTFGPCEPGCEGDGSCEWHMVPKKGAGDE